MGKFFKWMGGALVVICVVNACIEPYDPRLKDRDVNLLVVDGFLNTSEGMATISLTRTQPVKSADAIPVVSGAAVYIEDGSGNLSPLTETDAGTYSGKVSAPESDARYRLIIRTNDNREYLSHFIAIMETPPIDSISYDVASDGLQFAVNTHDPAKIARHYRWTFTETYEYHSRFNSVYMFTPEEIIFRTPEASIHTCWKTNVSTGIMVASNKHLTESVISQAPLTFIPRASVKISVKYSLLVQQQAITEEEYNYWLTLAKSTENLGGLFDPLPSEVRGNIYSTTDPNERILGYFSAGEITDARKTVTRQEIPSEIVPYYRNNFDCAVDTILLADIPNVSRSILLIDGIFPAGSGLIGYTSSSRECIDCRVLGGTTQKPPFWE